VWDGWKQKSNQNYRAKHERNGEKRRNREFTGAKKTIFNEPEVCGTRVMPKRRAEGEENEREVHTRNLLAIHRLGCK